MEQKLFTKGTIEVIDKEKLFVASDEVEDRQGEVIMQDGWDLKNFKKNPVIQWAHNSSEPAVATAEKIGFKTIDGKKKLVFMPKFHRLTPMSNYIGDLVDAGIIHASSVGFKPLEQEDNTYTKAELLEISFVNVPANQNALSLGMAKGYDEKTIKAVFPDIDTIKEVDQEIRMKELEDKIGKIESIDINKYEQRIKDMEENLAKITQDIREYLTSEKSGVEGREPKMAKESEKDQNRRLALKILNKATELLNKNERK